MRKIEKQMMKMIKNKSDWRDGNMSIKYKTAEHNVAGDCAEIYLHNNLIASYWYASKQPLEVNVSMLRRYPTVTTKSRLRALGANVQTLRGKVLLDNEEI